ncbi:MAG TPA: 50S ribosomal protein L25 [Pyrinomonadaceae bacterium]|nr:50S ribosomal protein L25 [Pyrinomonadaceae bacterium]
MAEKKEIILRATRREGRGKNDARRARRQGQVPLTIYGGAGEAVAALAPLSELAAILRSDTGRNTIFTVDVEGVEATEVMFADRQIDPVRSRLVHADFKRLVKGEKIEATVPLRLVGEPIGVREQAGVLEQIIREIEIRCEPRDIPEHLDVDVTNLGVHEVLHVSDIPTSEGVEILTGTDTVIATVGVVKEEPVEVAAPVEGEVPAEPEVIGKGKKEEEGEGGEEEK